MLIATFGANTGWAGKTISFENDTFVLEGYGSIQAADVMEYDRQGHLAWVNDGTRAWVGAKARKETRPSSIVPATSPSSTTLIAGGSAVTDMLATPPAADAAPSASTGGGGVATSVLPGTTLPWWRQKYVIPALAGIVVAVLALLAIAWVVKAQNDRKAAAKEAAARVVQPFRKLDSALDVGINFDEYGTLVRDAQFTLDSYHPSDSASQEVARHLAKAAEAYRTASEAWNDDIQDEFVTDASYWNQKCPSLSLPAGVVTADDVRQAAWVVGTASVKQASELVGL